MGAADKLKPDQVHELAVKSIKPDPAQPRKVFDEKALQELADSIKARGVLQPLVVRSTADGIVIKMGERRWRAAKLAGLKTVPCIVDADSNQSEIDRGLDQVAENEFRAGLNQMDLGLFLVRLRDVEHKSANEIAKVMEQHGMKDVSPATVADLMRLVELPDWAQDMVRAGQLDLTHSKPIHAAKGLDKTLKEIRKEIEDDIRWRGRVTVREVENAVCNQMMQEGIDLNRQHGERVRLFDIKPCRKCEFYRKTGKVELCFNAAEYDRKNKEAKALLKEADPVVGVAAIKAKPNKSGIYDTSKLGRDNYERHSGARFDVKVECKGCPNKAKGSYGGDTRGAESICLDKSCFHKKQGAVAREVGAVERHRQYLEDWLRTHLVDVVMPRAGLDVHHGLAMFAALGMPNGRDNFGHGADGISLYVGDYDARGTGKHRQGAAYRLGARDVIQTLELSGGANWRVGAWLEIAQACVRCMTREMLRRTARFLEVTLTHPAFSIDEAYLALKRRPQLEELAKVAGLQTIAGMNGGQLKAALLEPAAIAAIGVPADMVEYFAEPVAPNRGEYGGGEVREERSCRICGCTDKRACKGGCEWASDDVCSQCAGPGTEARDEDET
jgi:ParB family chromosome partitioning protein